MQTKAQGISIVESATNPGKLTFTDYEGNTTDIQGGFNLSSTDNSITVGTPTNGTIDLKTKAVDIPYTTAVVDDAGALTKNMVGDALDELAQRKEIVSKDGTTNLTVANDEISIVLEETSVLTLKDDGISANTLPITNVADPTADQDAATKKYVDDADGVLNTNKLDKTTNITQAGTDGSATWSTTTVDRGSASLQLKTANNGTGGPGGSAAVTVVDKDNNTASVVISTEDYGYNSKQGNINITGVSDITGIPSPVDGTSPTNKTYVDTAITNATDGMVANISEAEYNEYLITQGDGTEYTITNVNQAPVIMEANPNEFRVVHGIITNLGTNNQIGDTITLNGIEFIINELSVGGILQPVNSLIIYTTNPKGTYIATDTTGSGNGLEAKIITVYNNGTVAVTGELQYVADTDPVAQQSYVLSEVNKALTATGTDRGTVTNAYVGQNGYTLSYNIGTQKGQGYVEGDLIYANINNSNNIQLIKAIASVATVDNNGSIETINIISNGFYTAAPDVSSELATSTNSVVGSGATLAATTSSATGTTLASISNPKGGDSVTVLSDETNGNVQYKWIYADLNGDGTFNWVPSSPITTEQLIGDGTYLEVADGIIKMTSTKANLIDNSVQTGGVAQTIAGTKTFNNTLHTEGGIDSATGAKITLNSDTLTVTTNSGTTLLSATTSSINAASHKIINLADPTANQDAVTKAYLENQLEDATNTIMFESFDPVDSDWEATA